LENNQGRSRRIGPQNISGLVSILESSFFLFFFKVGKTSELREETREEKVEPTRSRRRQLFRVLGAKEF